MRSKPERSYKELIADNIKLAMYIYNKSRKEVCADLDIKYTTFTDYINGKTYPNMDVLDSLAFYFRIDTRDFLIDLSKRPDIKFRMEEYAKRLGVNTIEPLHTIEEYNETPEGYPVELIEGEFYVCESPSARHQSIVRELTIEISMYIRRRKGKCKVFPGPFDVELPIHLDTVVVPDITIICDDSILNRKRCVGAPDWIIEVISPSGKKKDRELKRSVYEKAGVREYWIIDPLEDIVEVYRMDADLDQYPPDALCYKFSDTILVGIYEDLDICMADLDLYEG